MDFASLLVTGAAPVADPSALLGAPTASPRVGEAFADLFAQAMVALPPGLDAGPVVCATDAASASPLASTTVPNASATETVFGTGTGFGKGAGSDIPVLPQVSGASPSETFSAETPNVPTPDASVSKDLEPKVSAPLNEATLDGTTAASPIDQGTRLPGTEKTGKKSGVPALPSCPTAPLLPDCPVVPSESTLPTEGAATEGGRSKDVFALDDEDSLDQAGSLAAVTIAPPFLTPNAPTINVVSTTIVAVPAQSSPTIASLGSATKTSEFPPLPGDVSPQVALPVALDLGIVPQVTVVALNSELSAPTPPVLGTPLPAPLAQSATAQPSPALASPQPPTAPSSIAVAPKDEKGGSAKIESVKGRETTVAQKTANEPVATNSETKADAKADLTEPVLDIAVKERKDDAEAPSGDSSKDASPENVVLPPTESGVHETAATARPEIGSDRPAVDRHLVVKQVADRIENMVAARPRDGVTIHMEPHDLGTVTLVVKGLASALDVQVTASDERVRQSLDASRPELAQALAPRGIGLREIRVEHAPSTTNSPSSTTADSGSGSSQNRSGNGSSQPQPKQSPSGFRPTAPATPRPRASRASRANGRGVDLLV